ncbi:hypothetical protein [Streptomyces sp.]|uniref:hypothetical protein n=1 Tax=Streptomyces sp. TaxID=1931 RepID=UPI0028114700|nr:hypothetical protein [Streptomyces sp.]
MARMRRGLVHALAWSLATGAAVTLSWWGVHTVLAGTAYDPPRALPLPAVATGGEDQRASSTHRPSPPPSSPPPPSPVSSAPATPEPSRGGGAGTRAPSSAPPSSAPAPATTPPAAPPSRARGYTVDGGRVTFDLGESSAELVSATPASGWRMQVWKQPSWIRVTFTRDGREQSVFCVWHDTAPRVQIEDRRA